MTSHDLFFDTKKQHRVPSFVPDVVLEGKRCCVVRCNIVLHNNEDSEYVVAFPGGLELAINGRVDHDTRQSSAAEQSTP